MRYKTLAELKAAYDSGQLDLDEGMLWLDNDTAFVYVDDGYKCVFRMHPEEILTQALDILGIPHEHV